LLVVLALVAGVVAIVETTQANALPVHGIGFFKGCESPTDVLSKTQCNFTITNTSDPDIVQITSLVDVVHAAGGDDNSGNVLSSLVLSFSGGASCNAGQTLCTLPVGGKLSTDPSAIGNSGAAHPLAFHTVTGADADNANPLADDAVATWIDTCSSGATNCPVGPQTATTGSQTILRKLPSATATQIHNAQHNVVTAVEAGTAVHDFVTVTGPPGKPTPTGKVNVDWFTNGNCSGSPAATSNDVNLVSGQVDVTGFVQKPAAGQYGFLAHYKGSSVYQPSDGTCEPLVVVDATITIAPNATNEVNNPHTFTVTVTRNDGTGFVPAAGVPVTYTLTDSNGAAHLTAPNPPTTCDGATDGNGQCAIQFTSPTGGKVVGNASVTLTLAGVTFTRDTDPATTNIPAGPGGSGPATKTFVDANITIAPNATNEVGQPHTFTVTVKRNTGVGNGFVNVPDGVQPTVTLTNSNGASVQLITDTCATPGTVSGKCTVTFVSPTAGKVTGNASVNLTIGGVSLSRDTNPNTPATAGPGGSGPAVKTYVDANIRITPAATNEVGQPHTFTVTVKRDIGNGAGLIAAVDGTKPTVTLTNSNGAAFNISVNTCATTGTVGGKCTVTFTSPTAGKVTGNASVTMNVGGVSLTRDTDPATANVGAGPGGSGPVVKTFVDAFITITPPTATNEVNDNHTFTITVKQNAGTGAFVNVPDGTKPTVTLVDSNGAADQISVNTCASAGTVSGKCTVTFTSASAGLVTGNASVTITVGGVTLTRDTDPATANVGSGPGGSGPALKTFVDANIRITPNATNDVNQNHTFTIAVKQDDGSGSGLVAVPDGTKPTVTLTNSNGAGFTGVTDTCANPGTVNGQCTVTFTSPTAGKVTGNASVTLTIGGVTFTRDTSLATPNIGSGPGGSGPAIKTYVDAFITIGPAGTNLVTDPHTFTVTVKQNNGSGGGFVNVPDGTKPVVTLTDAGGAAHQTATDTCANPGTVSGTCSVTFTSPTTGTTTGNASVTLKIGGITIKRDTDPATANIGAGPGGSGPALKTWIDIPTSASTAQFAYPNDTATITSQAVGDNLPTAGTVTFRLYQATNGGNTALQNCTAATTTLGSGGLIYMETKSNVGGANQVQTGTANTSVRVTINGTYYWLVVYDPGDQAHTGRSSQCVENTMFNFTNDPGPGTESK
jgi:hypothetical protein